MSGVQAASDDVRLIAFYLPQFHPIPENDLWWGKGFTEWTNVSRARPLFPGHYQPHLPADLGFYDLRLPEARQAQADLARAHGIHGFCYYHYWFNGKRLLERPLAEVLALKEPRFPFCICWANESWSRRWDGGNNEVLMPQQHGPEDDVAFIDSLIPYFSDERYMRVDGKPLLLVYRTALFPEPRRTTETWRERMLAAGIGELYLVQVESFTITGDPKLNGFDAAVQFPGHRVPQTAVGEVITDGKAAPCRAIDYEARPPVRAERAGRTTPCSEGCSCRGTTLHAPESALPCSSNGSPEKYGAWLKEAIADTRVRFRPAERLVFIAALERMGRRQPPGARPAPWPGVPDRDAGCAVERG